MTRNGKIARLPFETREGLNRRLRDGEPSKRLVAWLNDTPEVKRVLVGEFDGRPISEQNLSEWKQGGFEDWLRHEEARAWVQGLAEKAKDLDEAAGKCSVSDRLSAPLAVALGRCLEAVTAKSQDDPTALRSLLAIANELSMLRRGDHSARRLRLEQERWETEQQEKLSAQYADLQARMARMRRRVSRLKEDYENRKQAGTLTAEAKELCEDVFADWEDICRMPPIC